MNWKASYVNYKAYTRSNPTELGAVSNEVIILFAVLSYLFFSILIWVGYQSPVFFAFGFVVCACVALFLYCRKKDSSFFRFRRCNNNSKAKDDDQSYYTVDESGIIMSPWMTVINGKAVMWDRFQSKWVECKHHHRK